MVWRKIQDELWTDPKLERKSFLAKSLFVYLITNKYTNQSGIYELTTFRISQETNLDEAQIPSILEELKELVHWNPARNLIYIRRFLRRQCQNQSFLESAVKYVALKFADYLDFYIDDNLDVIARYGNPEQYLAMKLYLPESQLFLFETQHYTTNPPTNPPSSVSLSLSSSLYINNSNDRANFEENPAFQEEEKAVELVVVGTSAGVVERDAGNVASMGGGGPWERVNYSRGVSLHPQGKVSPGGNTGHSAPIQPVLPKPDCSRLKFRDEAEMAIEKCLNPVDFPKAVALMEREFFEFPAVVRHALLEFWGAPKKWSSGYFINLCRKLASDYVSGRLKILDVKPKAAQEEDGKYAAKRKSVEFFRKRGYKEQEIIQQVFKDWTEDEIRKCSPELLAQK